MLQNKAIKRIDDIEEIKKIPIHNFISSNYRKSGGKIFISCPLHEDKTPSLCIYTNTNSYYCFSCGSGGSVIDFIKDICEVTTKEAILYLKDYDCK